jgi:hypothetical protein
MKRSWHIFSYDSTTFWNDGWNLQKPESGELISKPKFEDNIPRIRFSPVCPWTAMSNSIVVIGRSTCRHSILALVPSKYKYTDYDVYTAIYLLQMSLLPCRSPVESICPFVCLHETTRKSLNRFLQNLTLGNFIRICRHILFSLKSEWSNGDFIRRRTCVAVRI